MSGMMGVVQLVFGCSILFSTTVLAFDGKLQFYPGDQFLIVGTKLRVNCTLRRNGSEFDLNKVYMKKGVEYIHNATFNRYEDDNTLEMIITNTSVNDSGSYLCYYGNDTHIQSLTKVSVVEMPVEPKNITCLSYQLLDMTCWFNLTKSTNLPMRWRMEYKLYRSNMTWQAIPESHCNQSAQFCWWDSMTMPPSNMTFMRFAADKTRIRISVTSRVGTIHSRAYKIYLSRIAKFGPVQNLAVTMGTDNAVIQWKCPKFKCNISSLVYDYKVLIRTSEDNWQTIERLVPGNDNKERNITVGGLIPYVNYTVAVWGKPVGADGEMYWSDPSILEVITLPDVPPYSVAMESGSYTVSDCGDFMCAILYWKNPEERYWFGQIVGYEVVVKTNSSAMALSSAVRHSRNIQTNRVVEYRNGLSEYLRLNTSLRKTDGYSLTVSLLNTAGKSKNVANVSISDWDNAQRLQASWVSVELPSTARISWEIDPHLCSQIVSVTVYWCQGQPVNTTSMQCQGNFGWDSFKVNDSCKENVKHISTNATRYEDLKYGVSIATDKMSGGIRWENFRFKKSKDVPVMTLFSVEAEQTFITINVLYSVYYVSDGGRPLNYHVSYREAKDEQMDCKNDGTKMKFPVNFSYPFYEIPDLDSGTLYEICVWSSNTAGHSDIAIPTRIESKEDSTGLIVVLSIVIPIAVILFIVIVHYGYKARRKRLIRENRTILPNIDQLMVDSNGIDKSKQPCSEQDSGKGDSPISSLSNRFLNGSAEEGSTGYIGITDNLSLNAFGRTEKVMSPVLPGYSRGLNGRVDIDDSYESNSLLEWQDADDSKYKCFESGVNCIEVAGKIEEVADVKKSKDTPTDTEYVDHNFPHRKSSAQTRKIDSISPLVQTNQSMPKRDQEYLPHSDIKMDTVRLANKTAIQPMPISNVNDAYVDESKNPVTNKLASENQVFCNRPEYFYFDSDEKGGHLKSGNTVDRILKTDNQERNHSESQRIYKSNESISSPQLDSYAVACSGDINADEGDNGEVSDHCTDSRAADLDANNEQDCLLDTIDNRIPPPSDESFGLDDDDSVDEFSEI